MKLETSLLLVVLLMTASTYAGEINSAPLLITLSTEKDTYRRGEKVEFRVVLKNLASEPLQVLVRSFNWDDLTQLDQDYKKRQEQSKIRVKSHRLADYPNLADELRSRGSPRPLGTLELRDHKASPATPNIGFDVDGLFCGTGLKNGLMPSGLSITHSFSIGPNVTWGHPGTYRFVWRAASPMDSDEVLEAVSNIVEVTITE